MRYRADNVGTIRCAQFNLTPLGFHGWADQYLEGYRELPPSSNGLPVAWLLLCRAIELEFKAWHRQFSKKPVLKDTYGHDLLAIYRALPKKHQTLSLEEVDLLTKAREAYARACVACFDPNTTGRNREPRPDPVRLAALTRKVIGYGDGLDLACM